MQTPEESVRTPPTMATPCQTCHTSEHAPSLVRHRMAASIRAVLKAHGLPLRSIAAQLDVAESTVSQWSWGHRFPKPEQLEAIGVLARVPVRCLLCSQYTEETAHRALRR